MATDLEVRRKGERIGSLQATPAGGRFVYDPDWLRNRSPGDLGVAFALPPRAAPYETERIPSLPPFFVNLLPEGALLGRLAKRAQTSESDFVGLLGLLGEDAVGDVTVIDANRPRGSAFRLAADTSFRDAYRRLMTDPEARLPTDAIAGAQPKMSVDRLTLPLASAGPGAFLKLTLDDRFPFAARNERFFMAMAADVGLRTARVELVADSTGDEALLVHRFDRRLARRSVEMLHQEDGCQILDLYPLDKDRVTFEELGEGVRRVVSAWPPSGVELLLQFAFGYLIGNNDQHAKNVSVLESSAGLFTVSPIYDMLCTLAYGDQVLALKLNGKDEELSRGDLLDVCRELQIPESAFSARLDAMIARSRPWLERLAEIGFDPLLTERLYGGLVERAEALTG